MDEMEEISLKEKQPPGCLIILFTLLYVLIFPFVLWFSLLSFMVFDHPDMTITFGLLFILLFLAIPLSIPFSIYFMWKKYNQKQYDEAYFFCSLPILTAFVMGFLINIVGFFFKAFFTS
jgi:hypothetical protein